jgi:multicomponent Na+:H+ antiporter subunit G
MIDIVRLIACILLTGAGIGCLVSGVVGVFRFKYALNRLHAAAILDTVGILLMLLGVIVATGFTFTSAKILVVITFLWLTSPVSGHLISRMEITINDDLNKSMAVIDRETVEHEKDADVPADTKEAN